jgi:hypothetical protein
LQFLFGSAFTRWYENKFSGTLPTEIGKLQKLREFWFFNMGLSGKIPTEIGLLSDVGTFDNDFNAERAVSRNFNGEFIMADLCFCLATFFGFAFQVL